MIRLTRIEKLDHQYPGLADSVKDWFYQGFSAEKVKDLLHEKYGISVARADIGFFRTERWVPEMELVREKRIAALAAQDMEARIAFRRSGPPKPASKAAGGER